MLELILALELVQAAAAVALVAGLMAAIRRARQATAKAWGDDGDA